MISPIFSIIVYFTLFSLSVDNFSTKFIKLLAEYFLLFLSQSGLFKISCLHLFLNIFITLAATFTHIFLKLGFRSFESLLKMSNILF
jgi:hypothetical protein